jgi:general secretion pathway protein C
MNHNQCMVTRLAAFVVWALVAGGVVYWSLKLLVRAPNAPPHSVAAVGAVAVRGDLTRLLGAAPTPAAAVGLAPVMASRFRLHGVMAPKGAPQATPSLQGVALISVDGKAPRAFAVGARVDSQLVLQSVSLRTASIGPAEGGASVKLEVPALSPPATGKLAAMGAPAAPVPATPQDLALPKVALPVDAQAPPAAAPTSRPPNLVAPRQPAANSR